MKLSAARLEGYMHVSIYIYVQGSLARQGDLSNSLNAQDQGAILMEKR